MGVDKDRYLKELAMGKTRKRNVSEAVTKAQSKPRPIREAHIDATEVSGLQPASAPCKKMNVGPIERAVSVVGGSALVAVAAERRDWRGLVLGLLGGGLVRRGW